MICFTLSVVTGMPEKHERSSILSSGNRGAPRCSICVGCLPCGLRLGTLRVTPLGCLQGQAGHRWRCPARKTASYDAGHSSKGTLAFPGSPKADSEGASFQRRRK